MKIFKLLSIILFLVVFKIISLECMKPGVQYHVHSYNSSGNNKIPGHENFESNPNNLVQENIFDLIVRGTEWKVVKLVKANPIILNSREKDTGNTPLHSVILNKPSYGLVNCMIENGADVNAMNFKCETPLEIAIKSGNLCKENIVELLSKKGAECKVNKKGRLLFCDAIRDGNEKMIDAFLNLSNFNPFMRESDGSTPLHEAVSNWNEDLIQKLIQRGVSIYSSNKAGVTPVDLAEDYSIERSSFLIRCNLYKNTNHRIQGPQTTRKMQNKFHKISTKPTSTTQQNRFHKTFERKRKSDTFNRNNKSNLNFGKLVMCSLVGSFGFYLIYKILNKDKVQTK